MQITAVLQSYEISECEHVHPTSAYPAASPPPHCLPSRSLWPSICSLHVLTNKRYSIICAVNINCKLLLTAVFLTLTAETQQTCLVCISRRINSTSEGKHAGNQMLGIEQFTTKQDLHGKILACDTGYEYAVKLRVVSNVNY